MNINDLVKLFSVWDETLGTILAAIGSTPSLKLTKAQEANLSLIGNVMQGTGSALSANIGEQPLNIQGDKIQAIGNSLIVTENLLPFDEVTKTKLGAIGEFLQALGASLAIFYLYNSDDNKNIPELYSTLLQTIGNSMQGLAGILKLKNKEWENVQFVGSWIQASGAIILAIAETNDFLKLQSTQNYATSNIKSDFDSPKVFNTNKIYHKYICH